MIKKTNQLYLLILILLPLVIMVVLQLITAKDQYKRSKDHLNFQISQAINRSKQQFALWTSHTSNPEDDQSYELYYVNKDSTFSFMISQSAQNYPLLNFEADTLLPALRRKQFLRFKEDLEKTRFKDKSNLHEFYLFRTIQYCKGCTDDVKSIASVFPIDSLVKKEMKKQGIIIAPKIAYYNLKSQEYSYLNDFDDADEFDKTRFKYSFANNEEVRILLPEKNKQLIYNMLSWFFSAFILIIISVFCFIWGRKILSNQSEFEEQKNDFINNITHEFKTPLATISFATANIENDQIAKKSPYVRQFTKVIKDENDRLNSQVEKLLQIASSQKNDFQLKKEKVNLHAIINELTDIFSLRVKDNGYLKCELKAAHAEVEGDPYHLSSMVSNLLDNAIKYSDEEVEIVVSTESDSLGVYLKVSDRGKGISKKDQLLIFDKFYRVSSGNLYDTKGFGLGLSYVKEIVEKHKGSVSVSSRLGNGSTFSVFLPFQPS